MVNHQSPGHIVVERVEQRDLAEIVEIEKRSFSDPWSEASFRDARDNPRVYFACAREHSMERVEGSSVPRVLGYVVAWFVLGEGEIANVAVAPESRGRGIGSALLDAALAEATNVGVRTLFLEVRSSNQRARHLYESRGFVEIGRRKSYYRRPVEDAVILRRTSRSAALHARHDV